ncbi:hypothetical protein GCM10023155_12410 [Bremerella cremea]
MEGGWNGLGISGGIRDSANLFPVVTVQILNQFPARFDQIARPTHVDAKGRGAVN